MISRNPRDEEGKTYGDMVVLEYLGKNKRGLKSYRCQCLVCGGIKKLTSVNFHYRKGITHINGRYGCKYLPELDPNIGLTVNDYTIVRKCMDHKHYIARCNVCGRERQTTPSGLKNVAWSNHEFCGQVKPKKKATAKYDDLLKRDRDDNAYWEKMANIKVGETYSLLVEYPQIDGTKDYRKMVCVAKYKYFADFKDLKTGIERSYSYWDICNADTLEENKREFGIEW